jgi:hypothetical protein
VKHHPRSGATIIALALAAVLALAPSPARAEEGSLAYEGALGLGAAVCTLVYSPIKLTYAVGGLVVSGLAWLWTGGDSSVLDPIYTASIGGDYVVTPSHLDGSRPLEFVGR